MNGKLPKEEVGWRRIVRNFTPSWFSVNMGTGIISILIHQLPYNADWVRHVSEAFFVLNIILFVVFSIITFLRYTLYPEIWGVMIRHPAQSLFLGCFPMGLCTIINMIVFVCAPWGSWAIYLAWGLWWFDVILSVTCCIVMPFPVMHHHRLELHRMTATLLLPFVPSVVVSSSGGIVAAALPNPHHATTTLIASYVIWGIGQAFAMMVLVIYFHRLCLYSLPPKEVIVSVFLPIGPLGQGGFGIQQLGKVALSLVRETRTFDVPGSDAAQIGQVLYTLGIFLALVMWGTALCWVVFALISIATTQPFPFNMGWWGFVFPLGVFTACTGLLAKDLNSDFFKILTMIFSMSVLLLWILVAVRTLKMAYTGEIFFAPCLADLRRKSEHSDGSKSA
ncbi:hypothetical protein VTK73DRAFT_8365 [Phialemonium thermophilum]|uniref:Sulfite efflux pump SSU1 n=1 Tax=Phialemonium thermophilum TaxID=223376 RepID=A0ABR3XPB5_9PEZI